MANTVVGFFDDAQQARRAVEALVSSGFDREDIDVTSGGSQSGVSNNMSSDSDSDRHSGGGNAISRFFNSLFGDDSDDARRYSKVGESSDSIVTVHANDSEQAEMAADILDDAGAFDVDEKAASQGYAAGASSQDMGSNSYLQDDRSGRDFSANRTSDNDTSIDRVEEELQVGKRNVEKGGVRVRSRIVERPVEENLRLREEHVNVERTPVNRPLSGNDMEAFREQEIEMTEHAEVPVVNKEARVVEEIRVSKEVEERQETVRDTVRHTEVDIDDSKRTSNRQDRTDSGSTGSTFDADDLRTDRSF